MSRTAEFDLAASLLEELTVLSRIEARGTLRIALKTAGFDATDLARDTTQAVVECILPPQLKALGIDDEESICIALVRRLSESEYRGDGISDSPEAVFARIGQR